MIKEEFIYSQVNKCLMLLKNFIFAILLFRHIMACKMGENVKKRKNISIQMRERIVHSSNSIEWENEEETIWWGEICLLVTCDSIKTGCCP